EENDLSTQLLRGYGCSNFLQWELPQASDLYEAKQKIATGVDVANGERKRLMASAFINHKGTEIYRWDANVFRIEAAFEGFYPTLMNLPIACIDKTRQFTIHQYTN